MGENPYREPVREMSLEVRRHQEMQVYLQQLVRRYFAARTRPYQERPTGSYDGGYHLKPMAPYFGPPRFGVSMDSLERAPAVPIGSPNWLKTMVLTGKFQHLNGEQFWNELYAASDHPMAPGIGEALNYGNRNLFETFLVYLGAGIAIGSDNLKREGDAYEFNRPSIAGFLPAWKCLRDSGCNHPVHDWEELRERLQGICGVPSLGFPSTAHVALVETKSFIHPKKNTRCPAPDLTEHILLSIGEAVTDEETWQQLVLQLQQ